MPGCQHSAAGAWRCAERLGADRTRTAYAPPRPVLQHYLCFREPNHTCAIGAACATTSTRVFPTATVSSQAACSTDFMLAGDWKEEEGLVSGCQAAPVCPGSPCDVLQGVGGATALSLGGEGGNSSAQSPLVKEHSKHVLRGDTGRKRRCCCCRAGS